MEVKHNCFASSMFLWLLKQAFEIRLLVCCFYLGGKVCPVCFPQRYGNNFWVPGRHHAAVPEHPQRQSKTLLDGPKFKEKKRGGREREEREERRKKSESSKTLLDGLSAQAWPRGTRPILKKNS